MNPKERRQATPKVAPAPEPVAPVRMPNIHKFRMPEPVASQTTLLATLVEGSGANESYNFEAARNAKSIKSIEDWVFAFQDAYRKRPATELDVTREGLEHAERVVSDYRMGLTEAMVTRAATLPEPEDIDPNTFVANSQRRRDIPYIADGMFSASVELDQAKLSYLLENPEEAGLFSRNPEALGSLANTAGGVAGEFVPGRGAVDFSQWARTAKEMGVLDGWVDTVIGSVFHGYTNQKVRERLTGMTSAEQAEFFKEFLRKYEDKLGVIGSNWHIWTMMEGIASDQFIQTMNPEDRLDFWMSNIASIGAWVEATGIGIVVGGALRHGSRTLPGAAEMLWRSRPSAGRRNLQHLVQNFSDADLARRWGVSKLEVVESQLPGPAIDAEYKNLPDGVLNQVDLERIGEAGEVAADIAARQNANIFTTEERLGIMSRVGADLESGHGGRLRPSMSRIQVFDDESGVSFRLMVGKDDAHGFTDLNEALEYAGRFGDGRDVEFFRLGRDGSTLEKFVPKVKRDKDGGWMFDGEPPDGEFFINFRHDHYFSPLDAALFGGDPVVAGTWMGRAIRWVTTPSAHLNETIYSKFVRAFTREQAMINSLDNITAPLFRGLTNTDRRKVNDVMLWAEQFGTKEGRVPTYMEIRAQFPEFDDRVLGGYYQTRLFYDTVHAIQNNRLYRAWHNQGYKTATNGTTSYHGAVLDQPQALGVAGKSIDVLDAKTGNSRRLSSEELKAHYDDGSVLIRLDLPMEATDAGKQSHKHVLITKDSGFKVRELSKFPLKHIPGYFTRMYEDAHFVTRTNLRGKIDGREARTDDIMAISPTRAEADRYVARQIDKLGRRLFKDDWDSKAPRTVKEARLREAGYEIRVTADSRLEAIDREAMDLGKFQAEGRLFFDNRNPEPARDIYGQQADVVDPINTIQRVSRMVSRQVAMEDLVQTQKNQFFETYLSRIPELEEVKHATSRRVTEKLRDLQQATSGEQGRLIAQAQAWWGHIHMMEGSLTADVAGFRKLMINAAEWFDRTVGGNKYAPKALRTWTKELGRNAHKVDAFRGLKSLAFLRFITARPLRQLILQGGQHMHLQAIDPTYIGRWQMDTLSLLSATRKLGRNREGRKLLVLKNQEDAKMMGYSKEEFDILLDEFSKSGLVDTVDVHTYAGGMPKTASYTPRTAAGRVTQNVGAGVTLPFEKMRAFGFDMGEQFNVTASWLMALRRHKAERGIKDLRKMSREDWDAVANRGSNYALAMHRANSAAWQYGAVSVPLQFLQFTHKWLLTSLGASKTMRKAGLANRAFTVSEARRIVAGQILLFGAGAFGADQWVKQQEQKYGLQLTDEQRSIVAHGIVDYMVDESLRALAEDPDLDFAIDDAFSPGGGVQQTARTFAEAAFDNKHWEFLGGPGVQAASKLWESARTMWTLSGGGIEGMTDAERSELMIASAAAGFMVSASDYLKIRMAQKAGQWTNSSGTGLGPQFEAKYSEMVLKGLFGVNPQRVLDYWDANKSIRSMEDDIRSDAREAFQHITRIHALLEEGRMTRSELLSQSRMALAALTVYDEKERAVYIEELYRLMANETGENESMFARVADAVAAGAHPDWIQGIVESDIFSPEEQKVLKSMLEDAVNQSEAWAERERDLLERNIDNLRGIDRE